MPQGQHGYVRQVRAVALTGYSELATSLGLDADLMLRSACIDPPSLKDPEFRLPARSAVSLLEQSASASGCETFGLRLAAARTFSSIGPLALLLRHERSLRDVFAQIDRFGRLMSDVLQVELEDENELTRVRVVMATAQRSRQAVELAMALTLRTADGAIWGGWRPLSASFMHSAPTHLGDHEAAFGCPIHFDAPFDGFVCVSAALDKPNAFSDGDFAHHARAYLETLERKLPKLSFEEQVRGVLRDLIPLGEASLDAAAGQLSVHPRALQRRLAADGTSFQNVLEETREELAVLYLTGTDRQMTVIAHQLGFQTPASFTRWFTQRMGKSPSAWRRSRV